MKKGISLMILSFFLGILWTFFSPSFVLAVYPEKPVTLICPVGPGGANDTIARAIAESMKKYFPKPIVVVNRPGGVVTIGTAETVTAKADGYTIGTTTMSAVTIMPHQMSLPYKTPDDYTPIALVGTQSDVVAVHSDSPFKTLNDFIEYARANPGKLRVGSFGVGHFTHLILEQLKSQAQIDVTNVFSKSGGEQVALLLGKHVDAQVLTVLEILPHVQGGKAKVLAVCDERRSAIFPEVPTFKESGYDITLTTYTLLIGPKELPPDVLSKLQEAYKKVSQDPNFVQLMERQGFTVLYEGTEELRKRLWKDYNANKGVLERLGEKKK